MSESNVEGKFRNWVFTLNANSDGYLPVIESLRECLNVVTEKYVFQEEFVTRKHYQGCFSLPNRSRKSTLLRRFQTHMSKEFFNNFTISRCFGTWEEAVSYCTKKDSATSLPEYSESMNHYVAKDLNFFDDPLQLYPWQDFMLSRLFRPGVKTLLTPHDREIIWVQDPFGNSGKSKFIKYLCYNNSKAIKLSFGTAAQLRSSVIAAGAQELYLVDIPRTLGDDDSIDSLISVMEDIKNGFVVSSMYGKYQSLMMNPPHVVVFSNNKAPLDKLSVDRWVLYGIDSQKDILNINHYM